MLVFQKGQTTLNLFYQILGSMIMDYGVNNLKQLLCKLEFWKVWHLGMTLTII